MSSKRGRKRNDNLPPNRARDVQRAFRARRAAHLQALEQRVAELEDENNALRQALSLPPANRPPLGRGPTGKDRPKTFESTTPSQPAQLNFQISRASSTESPGSARTGSISPSDLPGPRQVQVIDGASWDQNILMNEQQSDVPPPSSTSSAYSLPPLNSPKLTYTSYSPAIASSSRLPGSIYAATAPSSYAHPADRPSLTASYPPSYAVRTDVRDDPRSPYSYSQPPFPSDAAAIRREHQSQQQQQQQQQQHSPVSATALHPHHAAREPASAGVPYSPNPQRRMNESPYGNALAAAAATANAHSIGQGFPHLPNPVQGHHNGIRLPSPSQLDDPGAPAHAHAYARAHQHAHVQARAAVYSTDGSLNSLT